MTYKIYQGDCRETLAFLADIGRKVQTCVTSPPYFGLRDYGVDGQLGLEETPNEYVTRLVEVFRLVREVLADDGTLWLNLGDSYAGSWGNYGGQNRAAGKQRAVVTGSRVPNPAWDERTKFLPPAAKGFPGIKAKDLIGIPWRVAFALQADGWYLRQDIIWHKPNPMPESVRDRCTKAHEYIFLLSKSKKYYFDHTAIKEPIAAASIARYAQDISKQKGSDRVPGKTNGPMKAVGGPQAKGNRRTFRGGGVYTKGQSFDNDAPIGNDSAGNAPNETGLRNRRSVWSVATRGFKEAHFATFPPDLIEPCVLAGSRPGDTVLDPFGGAGTTGLVAERRGRDSILCELNPEYVALAHERLKGAA